VNETRDCEGVVRIIMRSIGGTDTLGGLFVDIVRALRGDPDCTSSTTCECEGVSYHLGAYAADFVGDGPHLIESAPNPVDDYDGFCDYVLRKNSKLRIAAALMSLGFAPDLLVGVDAALDVVEDPHTRYDKDTAVKFVGMCVAGMISGRTSSKSGRLAEIAERVHRIGREPVSCRLDNRTRFTVLDLEREIAGTNVIDTRKAGWSAPGSGSKVRDRQWAKST
jgi:hypothetical protein